MKLIFAIFLTLSIFAYADVAIITPDGSGKGYYTASDGKMFEGTVQFISDGSGHLSTLGASSLPMTLTGETGRTSIGTFRNDYTSTSVTTLAYLEIVASTTDTINQLQVFDSSGQTLVIAVGAAGLEVDKFIIPPGGNGSIDLLIPSGSRISIKALSADAVSGELDLTFLK